MKKRWLILVAMVAMAGCGGDSSSGEETSTGTDATSSSDAGDVSASDAEIVDVPPPPTPTVEVLSAEMLQPVPADLVLARIQGKGFGVDVHVEGIIRNAGLWLDLDAYVDDDFPFAAVLRDAEGEEVFRDTLREPIQIREFIANALVTSTLPVDVMGAYPELGDFAVMIPTDSGAERLTFERTELDGSVTLMGDFVLADMPDMGAHPLADSPVTQVSGNSHPSEALDIVVVGDGYTAEEMSIFHTHAAKVTAQFSQIDPYSRYADRINFYRIDVPSNESGSSFDCSNDQTIEGCVDGFRDTAFETIFPLRIGVVLGGMNISDRAIFPLDQWGLYQVAAKVPFDKIIVLVNTKKYGAFGLYHATLNAYQPAMSVVAVHEFGHAFALLGDEYIVEGDVCQQYLLTPDYPNIAELGTVPTEIKWQTWLDPGVPLPTGVDDPDWKNAVGLFEGAGGGCLDLYRPKKDCLMRSSSGGPPLCPICMEQTVRRFYEFVDFLGPDGLKIVDGGLVPDTPEGLKLAGEWTVDGEPAGPAKNPLVLEAPAEGSVDYAVELLVRESTLDVRRGLERMDEVLKATVRVTAP
jgi:hypothetical protein